MYPSAHLLVRCFQKEFQNVIRSCSDALQVSLLLRLCAALVCTLLLVLDGELMGWQWVSGCGLAVGAVSDRH